MINNRRFANGEPAALAALTNLKIEKMKKDGEMIWGLFKKPFKKLKFGI